MPPVWRHCTHLILPLFRRHDPRLSGACFGLRSCTTRKMQGRHSVAAPRQTRVATECHAYKLSLVVSTGSSRVHRWRRRGQSLVNKQLDLNATILSATLASLVLRNRIHFTIAVRRHDATQRNAVVLDQVANDGVSTTLAQLAIKVDAASCIGKARNLKHVTLGVHRLAGNAIKRS